MGMNVVIGDDLARYVESRVQAGEYASPQAVVEEALRVLRACGGEDAHRVAQELADSTDPEDVAWLRAAWQEGIDSGDAGPLDIEIFLQNARHRRAGET